MVHLLDLHHLHQGHCDIDPGGNDGTIRPTFNGRNVLVITLLILENSYNRDIPPIERNKDGSAKPADVSISITLMKVVEIEEVDHSIHLQFQISLMWMENRVTYQNLKKQTSLNVLTDEDIGKIWLPLIVYDNTDQKEVTRLGENWEWATDVTVTRDSDFTRSGFDVADEIEIFEGAENRLTMNQTYTWEFQCKYQLQRFPFDTQVSNQLLGTSFENDIITGVQNQDDGAESINEHSKSLGR